MRGEFQGHFIHSDNLRIDIRYLLFGGNVDSGGLLCPTIFKARNVFRFLRCQISFDWEFVSSSLAGLNHPKCNKMFYG